MLKYAEDGRTKYNAKRTLYGGVLYHSRLEADYAVELDYRVRAGHIKSWKRQVRIPLIVNGEKICDYVIDFVVEYPGGELEYVEVKGFEKPEWALKWKLLEALHPEWRKLVVKY